MKQSPAHRRLSNITLVLGILTFGGSLLWFWAGAGMYGSPVAGAWGNDPLTGFPNYWSFWMIWVVAAGPMALLPCAVLERRFPKTGAALLIGSALMVAEAGIRASRMYWGFATDDALLIAGLISLPQMLLAGSFLVSRANRIRTPAVAAALIVVAILVAGFSFRLTSYRDHWNAICPATQDALPVS